MIETSMQTKRNIAVLVSGRGSNLKALIDAASAPDFPAQIVLVLSNKADAFALEHARNAQIPTLVLSHKAYETREAFDEVMHEMLLAHRVEFVCLAGFMRILSDQFVARWQGKMINIHPSLLPKYKGLDTHARALAAGESEHGCSIHWVSSGVDEGEVIAQARVVVMEDDSEQSLAARVLEAENILYPDTLKKVLAS